MIARIPRSLSSLSLSPFPASSEKESSEEINVVAMSVDAVDWRDSGWPKVGCEHGGVMGKNDDVGFSEGGRSELEGACWGGRFDVGKDS